MINKPETPINDKGKAIKTTLLKRKRRATRTSLNKELVADNKLKNTGV